MLRRPHQALLFGVVLAGCMPSEPAFQVKTLNAASMVLISIDPGMEVIALEPGGQPYVAVPPSRQKELYVLRYPCPLEVLGMAPGRQEVISLGGRSLPQSDDLSHATIGISELEPVAVWPDLLRNLRLDLHQPLGTPCLHLTPTSAQLADIDEAPNRMLFAYPGDRAIAVAVDGTVRSIDLDGVRTLAPLAIERLLTGGFRANNGSAIFTSSAGSWLGTIEGGLGPKIPFDDPTSFAHVIAGDPDGNLDDLYAVGSSGNFWHFDGIAWELLVEGSTTTRNLSLVWLGPGHAVAVGVRSGEIVERKNGNTGVLRLPDVIDSGDRPTALGYLPGRGLAFGTQSGLVFIESPDTGWERVDGTFESHVRHIIAYNGSLFHGGRAGVFSQYRPEHGACETTSIGGGDAITIVRVEHGLIAVDEGPEDTEIASIAIDDTPPAQVCGAP